MVIFLEINKFFLLRVGTAALTINFETGLGIELGNKFLDSFISKFLII